MELPVAPSNEPKQADIKTEVFLAGSSSEMAEAISEAKQSKYVSGDSFGNGEAVKEENFEEKQVLFGRRFKANARLFAGRDRAFDVIQQRRGRKCRAI